METGLQKAVGANPICNIGGSRVGKFEEMCCATIYRFNIDGGSPTNAMHPRLVFFVIGIYSHVHVSWHTQIIQIYIGEGGSSKLWRTDVLELNSVSVIRSVLITCSSAGHKINHDRKSFRTQFQQLYTGEPHKIAWANGELSCAQ